MKSYDEFMGIKEPEETTITEDIVEFGKNTLLTLAVVAVALVVIPVVVVVTHSN